jgi:MFS family permease
LESEEARDDQPAPRRGAGRGSARGRRRLESIGERRAELADRLVTPAWYHPVLGLLAGGLIASAEAHRWWVFLSALVVYAVGCGVLVSSYRKLTGIWVSGVRRGPAGRVSMWLMGGLYSVAGLAALLDLALGVRGAFVVGGVVAVGLVVVLGRRFDEALRSELRA